jgi:hypothetical protein
MAIEKQAMPERRDHFPWVTGALWKEHLAADGDANRGMMQQNKRLGSAIKRLRYQNPQSSCEQQSLAQAFGAGLSAARLGLRSAWSRP